MPDHEFFGDSSLRYRFRPQSIRNAPTAYRNTLPSNFIPMPEKNRSMRNVTTDRQFVNFGTFTSKSNPKGKEVKGHI